MLTPTSGSITWRSASSTASVPGTARAQRTRRIRVDPMEVLEVLADLRVRKILVRHRQIVELLHHRLRHGIALEHLLGRPQPSDLIQWKYWRYWRISASERFWFGIGRLLNSFIIAFATGSLSSTFSGDFSHRESHASSRRFVTPARSGPSFLPCPTEWQARHLLSKAALPCLA